MSLANWKRTHPAGVFLLLTPQHCNLGDHAIALAEIRLLQEMGIAYYEITGRECLSLLGMGGFSLLDGAVLLINGGGNLGETMAFGRISGTNAAKRAKGEFTSETTSVTTFVGEIYAAGTTRPASTGAAASGDITGTFKDGVYEGAGTGIGGKIVVAVTIEGGKIAKVDIVSHNETEGLGGVALPEYARQTVEKQSLDIDVMTGVTVTLDAYKVAVNDALAKAVE